MKEIISIITLPVLAGLLLFFVPEKFRTFKGLIALLVSIITGYLTIVIYSSDNQMLRLDQLSAGSGLSVFGFDLLRDAGRYMAFNSDSLSKLIVLFVSLFTFLILLYSLVYIKAGRVKNYYPYFLITLGCAYGAVLSDNFLLFLAFWGVLGITLYKLIHGYDEESSATAKKTLILIGASDSNRQTGAAFLGYGSSAWHGSATSSGIVELDGCFDNTDDPLGDLIRSHYGIIYGRLHANHKTGLVFLGRKFHTQIPDQEHAPDKKNHRNRNGSNTVF